MSFNFVTGTYTPVAGAITAVPGQVIQSAVWNSINTDVGLALSACLTKQGPDVAETVIASAGTVTLANATSLRVQVTGTNTITSFGTGPNLWKIVRFNNALTLTGSSALITPASNTNIITSNGDEMIVTSDANSNWRVVAYLSATGAAPIPGQDAAESFIASAATVTLASVSTQRVQIQGTTTITSFGTGPNLIKIVRFNNILTLTYNASSLILPGAQNIITQNGDEAIFTSDASSNWRCVSYIPNNGVPITATASFRNIINRNGSMDIWQRGTAITIGASATLYGPDGWYLSAGANQQCTASAVTALVSGSTQAGQFQRAQSQTGTTSQTIGFPMDTDEVNMCLGKPLALQFVYATGANWSPANVVINAVFGTGSVVKQVNGYTNQTIIVSSTIVLAAGASATKVFLNSGALTVPTNVTQGEVQFVYSPVGTAGANDWIQLDDIQLEPYQVPTPFDRIPFDMALHRCKRHYQKTFPYATAPAAAAGTVNAVAALTQVANALPTAIWKLSPPMRITPTATAFSPTTGASTAWRNITGAADVASTIDSNTTGPDTVFVYSTVTVAAVASVLAIHLTANASI